MKFALESSGGALAIRGYEPGSIIIGPETYRSSLLVMADWVDSDWAPESVAELTAKHLTQLVDKRPEIVILGTGERQVFPAPRLFADLMDAGIGYEVMDTAAACRTYNILLAEGRAVLGALFLI